VRPKRICIDVDGTIHDDSAGYRWCEFDNPVPGAVQYWNRKYDEGNHITYATGRGDAEYCALAEWLAKWGFKFHRLVMGKVSADVYIDNRAVNFGGDWYSIDMAIEAATLSPPDNPGGV
jgi:hypothetical protein